MHFDVSVLGGLRSKRYSALVVDGAVTEWAPEPEGAPTGLTCSLAPALLKKLK